jgi:hypothetical protein
MHFFDCLNNVTKPMHIQQMVEAILVSLLNIVGIFQLIRFPRIVRIQIHLVKFQFAFPSAKYCKVRCAE